MGEDGESLYKVEYLDIPEDSDEQKEFVWIAKAGKAKVTYNDGSTYTGFFNEEKQKDGEGVYIWMEQGEEEDEPKQKASYEGSYKNGKKDGTGKMTFPSNDIYTGEWKENKMHGTGTYEYKKTGDIYSGTFVEGQKEGEGCYEFGADSSKLKGKWEKGKFITGEWIYKGAGKYAGTFQNGQPIGAGSFSFVNGIVQEGEYVSKGPKEEEAEEAEVVTETSWVGTPVYST